MKKTFVAKKIIIAILAAVIVSSVAAWGAFSLWGNLGGRNSIFGWPHLSAEGDTVDIVEVEANGSTQTFTDFTSGWQYANSLEEGNAVTVKLLSDVDIAETAVVSYPREAENVWNRTFTLDLNGFVLKMTGEGSVINVSYDSNFIVTDSNPTRQNTVTDATTGSPITVNGGVITGGNAYQGGGIFVDTLDEKYGQDGKLTIQGGNIVGNTATHGGGVFINQTENNYGTQTITLSDVTITGNVAERGGGVITLYMIRTENQNQDIDWIHVYVTGTVIITGNKTSQGKANNLEGLSTFYFEPDSLPSEDTLIGLTLQPGHDIYLIANYESIFGNEQRNDWLVVDDLNTMCMYWKFNDGLRLGMHSNYSIIDGSAQYNLDGTHTGPCNMCGEMLTYECGPDMAWTSEQHWLSCPKCNNESQRSAHDHNTYVLTEFIKEFISLNGIDFNTNPEYVPMMVMMIGSTFDLDCDQAILNDILASLPQADEESGYQNTTREDVEAIFAVTDKYYIDICLDLDPENLEGELCLYAAIYEPIEVTWEWTGDDWYEWDGDPHSPYIADDADGLLEYVYVYIKLPDGANLEQLLNGEISQNDCTLYDDRTFVPSDLGNYVVMLREVIYDGMTIELFETITGVIKMWDAWSRGEPVMMDRIRITASRYDIYDATVFAGGSSEYKFYTFASYYCIGELHELTFEWQGEDFYKYDGYAHGNTVADDLDGRIEYEYLYFKLKEGYRLSDFVDMYGKMFDAGNEHPDDEENIIEDSFDEMPTDVGVYLVAVNYMTYCGQQMELASSTGGHLIFEPLLADGSVFWHGLTLYLGDNFLQVIPTPADGSVEDFYNGWPMAISEFIIGDDQVTLSWTTDDNFASDGSTHSKYMADDLDGSLEYTYYWAKLLPGKTIDDFCSTEGLVDKEEVFRTVCDEEYGLSMTAPTEPGTYIVVLAEVKLNGDGKTVLLQSLSDSYKSIYETLINGQSYFTNGILIKAESGCVCAVDDLYAAVAEFTIEGELIEVTLEWAGEDTYTTDNPGSKYFENDLDGYLTYLYLYARIIDGYTFDFVINSETPESYIDTSFGDIDFMSLIAPTAPGVYMIMPFRVLFGYEGSFDGMSSYEIASTTESYRYRINLFDSTAERELISNGEYTSDGMRFVAGSNLFQVLNSEKRLMASFTIVDAECEHELDHTHDAVIEVLMQVNGQGVLEFLDGDRFVKADIDAAIIAKIGQDAFDETGLADATTFDEYFNYLKNYHFIECRYCEYTELELHDEHAGGSQNSGPVGDLLGNKYGWTLENIYDHFTITMPALVRIDGGWQYIIDQLDEIIAQYGGMEAANQSNEAYNKAINMLDGYHFLECTFGCGYAVIEEHTTNGECTNNGDTHSGTCDVCGSDFTASHVMGDWTAGDNDGGYFHHTRYCKYCDYQEWHDAELVDWDDNGDGQHYSDCEKCGLRVYQEHWSNSRHNDEVHYQYCERCGYQSDPEPHQMASMSLVDWLLFLAELGDIDLDGWDSDLADDNLRVWLGDEKYEELLGHTTTIREWLDILADYHLVACTECSYMLVGTHTDWDIKFDSDNHWNVCKDCGWKDESSIENHNIVSFVLDELIPKVGGGLETVPEICAFLTIMNENVSVQSEIVQEIINQLNELGDYDMDEAYLILHNYTFNMCADHDNQYEVWCGYAYFSEASECDHEVEEWFSNSDGTHHGTCTICDEELTENCDYEGNYNFVDGSGHWEECRVCGAHFNEEDHTLIAMTIAKIYGVDSKDNPYLDNELHPDVTTAFEEWLGTVEFNRLLGTATTFREYLEILKGYHIVACEVCNTYVVLEEHDSPLTYKNLADEFDADTLEGILEKLAEQINDYYGDYLDLLATFQQAQDKDELLAMLGKYHIGYCVDELAGACGHFVIEEHNFDGWTKEGDMHKRSCDCGYAEEHAIEVTEWTHVSDTNTHTGNCDICETPVTEECVLGEWTTVEGKHVRYCEKECGNYEEHAPEISGELTNNDNGKHTGKCAHCDLAVTVDCEFGNWTEEDGMHRHTCECGYYEEHAPNWGEGWKSTGNIEHSRTCEACGLTETALHDWSTWEVTERATCENGGKIYHKCDTCGAEEEQETSALGHELVDVAEKAATCTEDGWSAHKACTRCDYTTEHEEYEATGHTMGGWTTVADMHRNDCAKCDYYEEHAPNWGEGWKSTGSSEHSRKCVDCDIVETASHSDLVWHNTDADEHWQYCPDCDYETDHEQHGNWSYEAYETDQRHDKICGDCGYTTQENCYTTEQSWHKDGDNHWHECDVCDSWMDREAHQYNDEFTDGAGRRYCKVCEWEEQDVIVSAIGMENKNFHSIAEALDWIRQQPDKASTKYIITINSDRSGLGFTIDSDLDVELNLNGYNVTLTNEGTDPITVAGKLRIYGDGKVLSQDFEGDTLFDVLEGGVLIIDGVEVNRGDHDNTVITVNGGHVSFVNGASTDSVIVFNENGRLDLLTDEVNYIFDTDTYTCETVEIYINGEHIAHAWGDWSHVEDSNSQHTHKCSVCGDTETVACDFGAWTEVEDMHRHTCMTCDHYEEHAPEISGELTNNDDGTHTGKCAHCDLLVTVNCEFGNWTEEDGMHRHTCECGYYEEHTPEISGELTNNDNGTHTGKCAHCDLAVTVDCEFGNWTEEDGMHRHTCECGYYEEHAPNWGEGWKSTGSSEHSRTCETCGLTETAPHSPEEVKGYDATCTEDGLTDGSRCSVCGETLKEQETIPATGHSWSTWKIVKEATCTDNGTITRQCSECEVTEEQEVLALGHDLVGVAEQAATCTEDGWSAHQACTRCDYTTEHEVYEAPGHDFDKDWHHDETGHWHECIVCNAKDEVLEHVEKKIEGTDATCTDTGLTEGLECETCGEILKEQETISETGHSWTVSWEWTVDGSTATATVTLVCANDPNHTETKSATIETTHTEAACEADGYYTHSGSVTFDLNGETYTDSRVGEGETALDHNWGDWAAVDTVTCTADGTEQRTCDRCYATETRIVKALGHDWSKEWTTSDAEHWHDCSRCDATNDKATHTYTEWTNVGDHQHVGTCECGATLTEDCSSTGAYTDDGAAGHHQTCDKCGEALETVDHDWNNWTYTELEHSRECKDCNYVDSDIHVISDATKVDEDYHHGICDICEFEAKAAHRMGAWTSEQIQRISLLAETEQIHYSYCSDCAHSEEHVAAWSEWSDHSRHCTVDDCMITDEHTPQAGEWTDIGDTHVSQCTVCGQVESHEESWGDWSNHSRTCNSCNLTDSHEAEYEWTDNDGTHTGVCAICEDEVSHPANFKDDDWTMTDNGHIHTCQDCTITETQPHELEDVPELPAQCGVPGYTAHQACKYCEYTEGYEEIPALEHAWSDWTTVTEATCTQNGEVTRNCGKCGAVETHEIAALGHELVEVEGKAATCTENGWSAHQACTRCDYTTEHEEYEALGHDWDDGEITIEATCTTKGLRTYTCNECGATKMEEIAALGHELEEVEGKAATCTEDGYTAHKACTRCDYTEGYETISAEGHDWDDGEITIEATCTTKGLRTYTCNECGATKMEEIAALGHELEEVEGKAATCTEDGYTAHKACTRCDYTEGYETISAEGHAWSDWTTVTEATCTQKGEVTRNCSKCGTVETHEVAALGHKLVEVEGKAATCTEDGYTAHKACTRCDYKEGYVEILAEGHAWSDWTTVKGATCTEPGEATRNCNKCDAQETKELAAPGHKLVEVEGKAATCTEDGYTAHKACTRCDYTEGYEIISAEGHAWSDWTTVKEATCTEAGEATRKCSKCDAQETKELAALGHDLVEVEGKAATCTEDGYTAHKVCTRCDYTEGYETISAEGHAWSDWTTVKEATCTEPGEATRNCSKCDAQETKELEALGHDWSDDWSHDEHTHWHECNNGCDEKGSEEAHIWDDDGVCSVCGDLTKAKEKAKEKLDKKAEDAKDEIDKMPHLTDEEKEDFNKRIDEERDKGFEDIENSDTLEDIVDSEQDAEDRIDDILDEARKKSDDDLDDEKKNAKDEIDKKADDAKKEVDSRDDLTDEEKEEAKKQVDDEAKKAKDAIDAATSSDDIANELEKGKDAIDDILNSLGGDILDITLFVILLIVQALLVVGASVYLICKNKNNKTRGEE